MVPIYRTMAIWLGIAAALISAALGTATLMFELERVDQAIVELAVGEAQTFRTLHSEAFRHSAPQDASHADIEGKLGRFLSERAANSEGHFIIAEVYGLDGIRLGEAVQSDVTAVERALSEREHRLPTDAEPTYDKLIVDGQLYIRVVVRLTEPSNGTPIGYFEGVYHVSEARTASIRERILISVALVIGVVLCTTLFLVPVILRVSREQRAQARRLLHANIETLELLGHAVAKRDSDTGAHNYRVTIFAIRLAEAIGLSADRIRELIKGAFLHDVGKIAITDAILLKPGRLTIEEFSVMKTHVSHGIDIVSRSSWLHDAADVVLYHHEKFDGSGYLKGLTGDRIPINARIFAIADVFDALTSRRPYKEPFPFERAIAIIEGDAGSHFDPTLVAAFLVIARSLYDTFINCEEGVAELAVKKLASEYFRSVGDIPEGKTSFTASFTG